MIPGPQPTAPVQRQNDAHSFFYLAKHLEVFVPKPKTRELEVNLTDWLDHLLQEDRIPKGAISNIPDQGEYFPELFDPPKEIVDTLNNKFKKTKYWENIIYGYSTYETDGHFVGIDSKHQTRSFGNDFREQTLVIKFLLTNYSTSVYRDIVLIPTMMADKIAIVPAYASPSAGVRDPYYHELYFTHLHYHDITNHIITGIAETVLWKETEVWSHAWYSVLDRRCLKGRRVPIVQSMADRKKRFGNRKHEVLCVIDYARPVNTKARKHSHGIVRK